MENKQKTEPKKHSILVVFFILLVLTMLSAAVLMNVWDRIGTKDSGEKLGNNEQMIYSENTNTSLTNKDEANKVNSLQGDIESLINDLDDVTADEDSMISEIK